MKSRLLKILTVTLFILCFAVPAAYSSTYEFIPDPSDLYDLEHSTYITWGIEKQVPTYEKITGASLFFDNIRNWTTEDNVLYVHLLDTDVPGVFKRNDSLLGDQYSGQGVLLFQWSLPAISQDMTYDFNNAQLAVLSTYWFNNGKFGIGFDPDCHYYNDGITLTINTTNVPEPSTLLLLGLGLLGTAALKRKRQ